MNETTYICWLLSGFLPRRIRRRYLPRGHNTLQIDAPFWALDIHFRPNGRHDWEFKLSFMATLVTTLRAALDQLYN